MFYEVAIACTHQVEEYDFCIMTRHDEPEILQSVIGNTAHNDGCADYTEVTVSILTALDCR